MVAGAEIIHSGSWFMWKIERLYIVSKVLHNNPGFTHFHPNFTGIKAYFRWHGFSGCSVTQYVIENPIRVCKKGHVPDIFAKKGRRHYQSLMPPVYRKCGNLPFHREVSE
jgi:hypothetical protein